MNKKNILISLVSIIAFVTLSFFLKNKNKTTFIEKTKSNKIEKERERLKRVPLKNAKYKRNKKALEENSLFPKSCVQEFDSLSSMTVDEYILLLEEGNLFHKTFSPKCLSQLKENETYKRLAKNSTCDILSPDVNLKTQEQVDECSMLLYLMKAYSIVEVSRKTSPEEMSSEELAAHVATFYSELGQLSEEKLARNLKIIDTLYEIHGDDPSVRRAYASYLVIVKQIAKATYLEERIDNAFDQNLGESFELDRLRVVEVIWAGDPEKTKAVLNTLDEYYENEPELQYFHANTHWENGNRKLAIKYLDKAIALGDECSFCDPKKYKETRLQVLEAKLKDRALFSIEVDFSTGDL